MDPMAQRETEVIQDLLEERGTLVSEGLLVLQGQEAWRGRGGSGALKVHVDLVERKVNLAKAQNRSVLPSAWVYSRAGPSLPPTCL